MVREENILLNKILQILLIQCFVLFFFLSNRCCYIADLFHIDSEEFSFFFCCNYCSALVVMDRERMGKLGEKERERDQLYFWIMSTIPFALLFVCLSFSLTKAVVELQLVCVGKKKNKKQQPLTGPASQK